MSALSYVHAANMLDYSLRSGGTLYLALYLTEPGTGDGGTEISGTGYSRKAIAFGDAPAVVEGVETLANTADVNFGTATSAWGSVGYWGIHSAASGHSNSLLWYGAFRRAKTIEINDSVVVAAGDLVVTLG